MKLISILAIIIGLQPAWAADEFKGGVRCHTKVFQSACGSGEIEVTLNQYGDFKLHYGDVRCWGTNTNFKGSHSISTGSPKIGFHTNVKYDLLGTKIAYHDEEQFYQDFDPAVIATFEYDKNQKVGLLKIGDFHFFNPRGDSYYMQCEGDIN